LTTVGKQIMPSQLDGGNNSNQFKVFGLRWNCVGLNFRDDSMAFATIRLRFLLHFRVSIIS
jgi:hypothetical protein